MGFCSGTQIFDDVMFALKNDFNGMQRRRVIRAVAGALEDHDWDCHQDSQYYAHPDVQKVFRKMHPDWFVDDEEEGA